LTQYEGFLENPDLQALCTIYFGFEDSSWGIHLSFGLFLWVVFIPWTDYMLFRSFLLWYVFFVGRRLRHKTICFVSALVWLQFGVLSRARPYRLVFYDMVTSTSIGIHTLEKKKGVHVSFCSISLINHNLLHLIWEE